VLVVHDAITISDVAVLPQVRTPTASKAVTRLAALGFVARAADPQDARTVTVQLTRKGRLAVGRIQPIWDEVESDVVAELGSTERTQLHDLLRRAARNLATAAGSDTLTGLQGEKDPEPGGSGPSSTS